MKIAVLGSGNGGCAAAYDWSSAGHEVFLFDFENFRNNIDEINRRGGIESRGALSGFTEVAYAGTDLKRVIEGAGLIFVIGPAYSTKAFGEACRPYLADGQKYIVCPSSCGGSIVFKNALGLPIDDSRVTVAETSTLPYAVRLLKPGEINVFLKLKGGLFIAAVPKTKTQDILDDLKSVYPCLLPASSVLQTTLQNANPVIHPAVTLLNAALIERTGGDFYFYEEGVTAAVGKLLKAIDTERISIGEKLGFKVIRDPELGLQQGYMYNTTYDEGYIKAPGFKGIKAQPQLDYRYFNEDVGYGLVFMAELAKQIGVETPAMDAVIKIVSIIMDRDYRAEEARTLKSLGLGSLTLEEIKALL